MSRERPHRAILRAVALAILLCAPAAAQEPPPDLVGRDGLPSLAPLLVKVRPAVVNIAVVPRGQGHANPLLADPFFRRFFGSGGPPADSVQSVGSGVIVNAEAGIVLTNHHVVADASRITVTLTDKRQLEARLVGSDPPTDVAVLSVPAEGLSALPFADSDRLEVGDYVVAIGNPFGLGQTVTSGIVSALGRSGLGLDGYEDFIQTDASINPGNSGGALVDLSGRLAGINTAILGGGGGGNIGIGFAVPANMARGIMAQILEFGAVRRGRMGATAEDVSPGLAASAGMDGARGAVVRVVDPGSPAAEAGMQPGDIILSIDGRPVRDGVDLRNRLGLLRAGTGVTFGILRDGSELTLEASLSEAVEEEEPAGEIVDSFAGALFVPAEAGVGVAAVEGGSAAARWGLRPGDVVTAVAGASVGTVDDLVRVGVETDRPWRIDVTRGPIRMVLTTD